MTQFTVPASLDDFKAKISSGSAGLARPNKFMVELPQSVPGNHMSISDLNIMCKNVSLPGRQVTTLQKVMGLRIEKMANGFAVDDITFSFYVQNDYNVKKYFEAWQNLAVNQQTYELGYKTGPGGYGKQVRIHQLAALEENFNPQASRSAIARRGRRGPLQFDGKAKDTALEKVIYTCVLEKAFPTTLNSIEMNSEQGGLVEVSIQLSYTDWRSE